MTSIVYPPKRLSHYTTLSGLMGIIDEGALWASNASFLNDRSELVHALDAAEAAISKLSTSRIFATWEPLLKEVLSERLEGKVPDTYVICFCRDDDNLSQWRGYGGDVQGICLHGGR